MVFVDPITRQRLTRAPHTGDMEYDLNGDSTVANEDVPVIGPWTDWTGSNFKPVETDSRNLQILPQGNKLMGTDAAIAGGKDFDRTDRGKRLRTHRQRIIKRHVDFDEKGNPKF